MWNIEPKATVRTQPGPFILFLKSLRNEMKNRIDLYQIVEYFCQWFIISSDVILFGMPWGLFY